MCTSTIAILISYVLSHLSSHYFSRNREAMIGGGSAAAGSAVDDEPGWEYHVGSMGRYFRVFL
jgi:hypothetical protein